MTTPRQSIHGAWSSRWIFILAATGSAVGLGNIWKFPYITGVNGGGAFVLVYLLCIALIGVPIMIAEIMLGRRGRQNPIGTMKTLAEESGRSPAWQVMGWGGVAAGFIILSFYSVIAGWAIAYVFRAGSGAFSGADAETVGKVFSDLIGDPERLMIWHTLFMIMTMGVVARGVQQGLETAVRYLMPMLALLLAILLGYALNTGAFGKGVEFFFNPDFSKITGEGVLVAMGHAFFTLSLGMGAIMVYGSYLPAHTSIMRSAVTIAAADTGIALVAGLIIFPIVFAHGLEPGSGPGLIFVTLPIAFGQMPGGDFFGALFFLLLVFAAWTSAISIAEPVVAWLVESHGFTRKKAAVWGGIAIWFIGIGCLLSFNLWADFKVFFGKNFFDFLDYLASNVMLPLGGLMIALFTGWIMKEEFVRDEIEAPKDAFRIWLEVLKYLAPIGVILVFLNALGLL